MKLLVVDDDSLPRKMLSRALSAWGHTVAEASDGDEAWDLFCENPPDLMITDWMMPCVDGLELCQRVRAGFAGSYTYIILLTSQSQSDHLVEALAAGADEFLQKPFNLDELRARIGAGERIVSLQRELAARLEQVHHINEHLSSANRELRQELEVWMNAASDETPADPLAAHQTMRREMTNVLLMINRWMNALESCDVGDPAIANAGEEVSRKL